MSWAEEVEARLAPLDTDERFALAVSPLTADRFDRMVHVGWHGYIGEEEYGMAVLAIGRRSWHDAGEIAELVRENYEASIVAGKTRRP